MKTDFIPLDYDSINIQNKTYIKIFGKDSKGKTICLIDEAINFFYILTKNPKKLLPEIQRIPKIKKTEITKKNYLEKPVEVIKIFCEYKDTKEINKQIKKINEKIKTREIDINLITRYIIEKNLTPLVWKEIEGKVLSENDLNGLPSTIDTEFVIKISKINKSKKQFDFKPKILAFDIETEEFDIGRGEIFMISIVSDDFKKVLTWKSKSKKDFVEHYKNEKEMILKFQEYVKKINPDIITGYFSDGFDLPYLRARAEKNKINLKLGKDNSKIIFSRGRPINAKVKGRVHIDLLKFIETVYSQYLQSETLSLNEVAKELLGESKLEFEHNKKSTDLKKQDWENFFEYNLQDSILTYKLFEKFWDYISEFTKIIQEPLFHVTRYGMTQLVENYFIHNLNRFNEIAERKPNHDEINERRMRKKFTGAFVLQPVPGLYENLAMFDFTSMYASVIVSFNLSAPTFLGNKKQSNSYEIDLEGEKVYFSKKQGFIPKLLSEIIDLRKKYKKEYSKNKSPIKKARSNSFKLLANATFGYQGFFGARWYCPEAAASTAALAKKFIKKTIEKTNKEGFHVIYADTDGFAFTLKNHTKEETKKFLKKLNSNLPGVMELDLEDFYKRGIWVTKRTGDFGAKKKYALIDYKGKLKIRGFETVRRDWCILARELQNNILRKILKEGNEKSALEYTKEIIKKVKERKINKSKLIIKTQLKKPISEYKSQGPHVVVAKKMKEKDIPVNVGMLIQYYIAETKNKKALVRDKAKLIDEDENYDVDYYLKHQIIPAIENIFEVFGINVKEIVEGKTQMSLDKF